MGDASPRAVDWPLVAFFALAFAIANGALWALDAIASASGLAEGGLVLMERAEAFELGPLADRLVVAPFAVYLITRLADFSFSIAGVLTIAWLSGRAGLADLGRALVRWRVGWVWYGVALGLPLLLYGVSAGIAIIDEPALADPLELSWAGTLWTVLLDPKAGILVYLLTRGGLGEELGLRGFALPRLQERYTPLRSSLLIGLFWGLWHVPVLVGRDPVSIVAFLLAAFAFSILFTWLYNATGGSLLVVALLHAALNAFDDVWEAILPGLVGVSWEVPYVVGVLGVGAILGVALARHPTRKGLIP